VLQLRGTFRADRHGKPGTEPVYPPLDAVPPAPGFLDELGAFEWERVGRELVAQHILTEVALGTLTGYCVNASHMVQARRDVLANGIVVTTALGEKKANPAVMIARQAGAEMLKFAKELGITPASLTRVKVGGAEQEKAAADPWDAVASG
jgi:P27 family predicted phage terminase small subunit